VESLSTVPCSVTANQVTWLKQYTEDIPLSDIYKDTRVRMRTHTPTPSLSLSLSLSLSALHPQM
jgi:hypothetical protein